MREIVPAKRGGNGLNNRLLIIPPVFAQYDPYVRRKLMKKITVLLLVVVLLALAFSYTTNTPAKAAGKYDGIKINVLTFTGPQIAEPLQRRAPDFKAATGADVSVVVVPFADLYQTILKDAATKTNSYQAYVLDPQ